VFDSDTRQFSAQLTLAQAQLNELRSLLLPLGGGWHRNAVPANGGWHSITVADDINEPKWSSRLRWAEPHRTLRRKFALPPPTRESSGAVPPASMSEKYLHDTPPFIAKEALFEPVKCLRRCWGYRAETAKTEDWLAERGGFEPPIELLTL
jgi:hypothetical protein